MELARHVVIVLYYPAIMHDLSCVNERSLLRSIIITSFLMPNPAPPPQTIVQSVACTMLLLYFKLRSAITISHS